MVRQTANEKNIYKFQLLQNFAALALTDKNKFEHVTQTLKDLGWAPVEK